nr:hypothetical protein P5630_02580 [Bacillus subtilis]
MTEYIERKEDRRFLNACTEHMRHWWNEIEKDETEATTPLKPQQVVQFRLQEAADR